MDGGGTFRFESGRADTTALQAAVDLVLAALRRPRTDPEGRRADVVDLVALTGLPPVDLAAEPAAGDLVDLDLSWVEITVHGRQPWDDVLVAVTAPALGTGLTADGARALLDLAVVPALHRLLGTRCIGACVGGAPVVTAGPRADVVLLPRQRGALTAQAAT